MSTTLSMNKYKKPNWKYVDIGKRDRLLFKTIWEQKFLTRNHVLTHIFGDCPSYGEIRVRKLKKFGYLRAIKTLAGESESYLLGEAGVAELRRDCPAGLRGWGCPSAQTFVEIACYEHDKRVTDVRFLFEKLGLCKDWKSEKLLKAGVKGERKVPDGIFTRNGKGIAVEIELHTKKASTYRKIFQIYESNPKIHYIFYVCGDLSVMRRIMDLSPDSGHKIFCFALYSDLMTHREMASFRTRRGSFRLKDVLE